MHTCKHINFVIIIIIIIMLLQFMSKFLWHFYSVCNTSLFSGIVDGVMVTSHCFVEPSSLLVP